MADSSNGWFPVLHTLDGQRWTDIGDRLPPAQAGESAFAASGTCVATFGERNTWIPLVAAAPARSLVDPTADRWAEADAELQAGSSPRSSSADGSCWTELRPSRLSKT